MNYAIPIFIFLTAYVLNLVYITVFYHRGLTHRSVLLSPLTRRFVIATGDWVTGIDPKAWCCMHRLHHKYADTERDPHSPIVVSVPGVLFAQLLYYRRILAELKKDRHAYDWIGKDLDFPVNWLNRHNVGLLPFFLHAGIGGLLGSASGFWYVGLAYWLGMMTHPLQGWMVNALGHRYGYRNYETPDNSRNNAMVAWLVMGEGYQNNHHRFPRAAKFSRKPGEVDLGYGLCRVLERLGVLTIRDREPTARAKMPELPTFRRRAG